jgi:O-antigen ligase/tetratricopeptide (TPR) repeat protein
LSVLLFSLIDLPFQMPELVVLFAAVAGRIELKDKHQNPPRRREDAKKTKKLVNNQNIPLPQSHRGTEESQITTTVNGLLWRKNYGSLSGAEWILLAVFLVTGFWPPFRPWNFLLLAGTLWVLAGLSGKTHDRIALWSVLGVLFFIFRALASPSASGCVRFFELTGILLAFVTVLPALPNRERFLKGFGLLGLAWAVKVWWETFHYNTGGLGGWIHFQFSDVKDWIIFPDPKQIGLFLIPLLFMPIVFGKSGIKIWDKLRGFDAPQKPVNGFGWAAALAALLTLLRLKSEGGFLGFIAGGAGLIKKKHLPAFLGLAAIGLVVLLAVRTSDPSSTKWGRFEIWDSALKVFSMSPVLGQGPGAFEGLYHQVKEPREGGVSRFLMDARYAHNEALEALEAFGLVGLILLVLWLVRLWPGKDQPWHKASILGLGAASLTEFCLHTPLMALWGTAFLHFRGASPEGKKVLHPEAPGAGLSPARGFLVLGIALALFAPRCFIPAMTDQFQGDIQANHLPQALRRIETAEALDPWDAGLAGDKLEFLEKLYLATGDDTWKRRADEAQGQVIGLEGADGFLKFEKAQRLTRRVDARPVADNLAAAQKAWEEAEGALPTNAFVRFEKGAFYFNQGPGKAGKWDIQTLTDGATAFMCFRQAGELEPHFAQAWYFSGLCRRGMGEYVSDLDDYRRAYEAYDRYKSAERIDPLEKLLVSLTPEQLKKLRYELGIK